MWHGELRWEVVEISLGRCASEIDGGREEMAGSRVCFKSSEVVICFPPALGASFLVYLRLSSSEGIFLSSLALLPFGIE